MTVVRWRPSREMNYLQREMNRVFDSFFQDADDDVSGSNWYPSVDIKETADNVEVFAELPGLRKEDINLSVRDNVLTIAGEKRRDDEEKEANFHRLERMYGTFTRSFTLPARVVTGKVDALFKDGILHLVLPKAEDEKPKQIEIK